MAKLYITSLYINRVCGVFIIFFPHTQDLIYFISNNKMLKNGLVRMVIRWCARCIELF